MGEPTFSIRLLGVGDSIHGSPFADMNTARVLVLLFACLLPWQAVQADVSAMQADQLAAEMADMPCHSAGSDCCDDNCQQMASCAAGTAMCPPAVLKIGFPVQGGSRLALRVESPPSAILEHPFRPPIPLAA